MVPIFNLLVAFFTILEAGVMGLTIGHRKVGSCSHPLQANSSDIYNSEALGLKYYW